MLPLTFAGWDILASSKIERKRKRERERERVCEIESEKRDTQ